MDELCLRQEQKISYQGSYGDTETNNDHSEGELNSRPGIAIEE